MLPKELINSTLRREFVLMPEKFGKKEAMNVMLFLFSDFWGLKIIKHIFLFP